jgi:hypothetical protein
MLLIFTYDPKREIPISLQSHVEIVFDKYSLPIVCLFFLSFSVVFEIKKKKM